MELQVILNDVARIMDIPFNHSNNAQQNTAASQTSPAEGNWSNPISPVSSSSNENVSNDAAEGLFPWGDELRFALDDVKVGYRTAVEGGRIALAAGTRKRKRWCDMDAAPPPQLAKIPSGVVGGQDMGFVDEEVMVEPILGDCGAGGKRDNNVVVRYKDTKDPLDDSDQNKEADKECGGEGRMSAWQVDDIPDLDGSLSGLGVDLSGYTMNEGLLALPSLTIFKQEAPSPSSHNDNVPTNIELDSNAVNKNSQLHHILQHQSGQYGNSVVTTIPPQQQTQLANTVSQGVVSSSSPVTNMTISSVATSTTSPGQHNIDCRFQYVLAAATSTATKVNEETLTYLNQGQSYEIKLKKLGELSAYRGKILKSVIRICFHERRLQYMEKEQMAAWQASRPGERILEVDVPLSYGLYDVSQDRHNLNTVKFLWDPTKEVGVYVKVNCISTEFTPKRHGGEKGVTFKIQVETYFNGEDSGKHLHSAACQIKVFKLKGADRKHKQDRERILKRPLCEQDKFQPSYDCTVLNDIPVESQFFPSGAVTSVTSSAKTAVSTPPEIIVGQPRSVVPTTPVSMVAAKEEHIGSLLPAPLPVNKPTVPEQRALTPPISEAKFLHQPLPSDASAQQTAQWLQAHRFGQHLRTFTSFSGADVLRLSRDDLIQICGLADGIRLYNALHAKAIAPRLTVYLCVEQSSVYHALFLSSLSCLEMANKLAQLMGVSCDQIRDIYVQGPGGIHVLITDEVVRNIKDESMYTIEILQAAQSGERYRLLLKPAPR